MVKTPGLIHSISNKLWPFGRVEYPPIAHLCLRTYMYLEDIDSIALNNF